jgi:cytochrome c
MCLPCSERSAASAALLLAAAIGAAALMQRAVAQAPASVDSAAVGSVGPVRAPRLADTTAPEQAAAADGKSKSATKLRKIPALYSEEQATKGAFAYYQNCAMCHGPLLNGQMGGYSGPALKGSDFADPSYDFHVSDIFNFVAKLMPAATPGSLTHEQDVDIMAFILKQNGYPAGAKELIYEEAEKSNVPIRYYGK